MLFIRLENSRPTFNRHNFRTYYYLYAIERGIYDLLFFVIIVSNILNEMIDNLTLGVLTSRTRTRISPTISGIEFALQKTCPKISI